MRFNVSTHTLYRRNQFGDLGLPCGLCVSIKFENLNERVLFKLSCDAISYFDQSVSIE